jgi:hypothetical protein
MQKRVPATVLTMGVLALVASALAGATAYGAGQHWTVTFTDNGTQFFNNNDDVSTATREVHANPAVHNTVEVMAAKAVRKDTGEVITGSVKLDPAPAKCGPLSP